MNEELEEKKSIMYYSGKDLFYCAIIMLVLAFILLVPCLIISFNLIQTNDDKYGIIILFCIDFFVALLSLPFFFDAREYSKIFNKLNEMQDFSTECINIECKKISFLLYNGHSLAAISLISADKKKYTYVFKQPIWNGDERKKLKEKLIGNICIECYKNSFLLANLSQDSEWQETIEKHVSPWYRRKRNRAGMR